MAVFNRSSVTSVFDLNSLKQSTNASLNCFSTDPTTDVGVCVQFLHKIFESIVAFIYKTEGWANRLFRILAHLDMLSIRPLHAHGAIITQEMAFMLVTSHLDLSRVLKAVELGETDLNPSARVRKLKSRQSTLSLFAT